LGHGKTLKTKTKEASALKLAELKAQERWNRSAKGQVAALRSHLGKFIDRIEIGPITKFVAIIGMTIVIKKIVDTTEDLKVQWMHFSKAVWVDPAILTFGLLGKPGFLPEPVSQIFRALATEEKKAAGLLVVPPQAEGLFPEWLDWLLCFTFAYVIVENFGEICKLAGNVVMSLGDMIKTMIGSAGAGAAAA